MCSLKIKKVMTSLDLAFIVKELRENLVGSRIDNIYQISQLTFLFKLRPKMKLILEVGRRIHLTQYEVKIPSFPSLFCRILRKFLRRGIIQDIQIIDFERIVIFKIASKETSFKLIIEVFGKGNIILVDDENKILHAVSYRKMRDRNVIRGEVFILPPSRGLNPLKTTLEQMLALKETKGTLIQSLTKLLNIGGLCAEEVLFRAGIDKKRDSKTLTNDEVNRIYIEVFNLTLNQYNIKLPHIVLDNNKNYIDVLPFPFLIYKDVETKEYPSYNEAADEYFTKLIVSKRDEEASKEDTRKIEEQRRILNQQQTYYEKLRESVRKNQIIGDLIYSHTTKLQNIIQFIKERRDKGKKSDEVISSFKDKMIKNNISIDYLDSIDIKRGIVKVIIDNFQFDLNLKKTLYNNASSFYSKVKKAKMKMEGINKAIIVTKRKIEELKQKKIEIEEPQQPLKVRKLFWFEKFHWVYSSEGFLVLGGRDATTNEVLIKKHTNFNDLIFHADINGAPFVTIKTEGKQPLEKTIFEAAQLAGSYSRAWKEGFTSLDVYWVNLNQISKEAPSGEYLTKGMFMIRGNKNYIRNVPLRISIGIIMKDNRLEIVGGPVTAIASQTRYMITIVPGRQTSGRLAKEIRLKLSKKVPKDLQKQVLKIPINEIQRFIPAGKGEALRDIELN